MFEAKETKWVIMDKARAVIAKGSPRNRWLIAVNNTKDKKRILYYSSKKMAEAGFSVGFYSQIGSWKDYDLEAVEVEFTIREK